MNKILVYYLLNEFCDYCFISKFPYLLRLWQCTKYLSSNYEKNNKLLIDQLNRELKVIILITFRKTKTEISLVSCI